jgi:hypothetical protein
MKLPWKTVSQRGNFGGVYLGATLDENKKAQTIFILSTPQLTLGKRGIMCRWGEFDQSTLCKCQYHNEILHTINLC